MSNKKTVIEVTPPRISTSSETIVEFYELRDFACPVCSGRGWYQGIDDETRGDKLEECNVCSGIGKLKALISISWHPCTDDE